MIPHYQNEEYNGICLVGYKHGKEDMKQEILNEISKLDTLTNRDAVMEWIKRL